MPQKERIETMDSGICGFRVNLKCVIGSIGDVTYGVEQICLYTRVAIRLGYGVGGLS